jgi:hypothetical protein
MKKILFSFVGSNDPFGAKDERTGIQTEGSIVSLVHLIKPDILYLFPTAKSVNQKSTESNAREVEDWLVNVLNLQLEVYIYPLRFNPTNYKEILRTVRREISDIWGQLPKESEIHINASSGTPQLKNTWLLLAYSGIMGNPRIWQVANPNDVKSEEERFTLIDLDFFEEENLKKRIYTYTDEMAFGVVADDAKKLRDSTVHENVQQRANFLFELFIGYEMWDLIFYKKAYEKIRKVYESKQNIDSYQEVNHIIETQMLYLDDLKNERPEETPYNLVDLYFNAQRRFNQQNYTDTLARFWRVYEGTLFYRLREQYGIYNRQFQNDLSQENKKLINNAVVSGFLKREPFHKGEVHFDRATAQILLKEVYKDQDMIRFLNQQIEVKRQASFQTLKIEKILDELREKRNQSIVAHGMKPVDELDAYNSLLIMKALIFHLIPNGEERMKTYPLSKEVVKNIVNLVLHEHI